MTRYEIFTGRIMQKLVNFGKIECKTKLIDTEHSQHHNYTATNKPRIIFLVRFRIESV